MYVPIFEQSLEGHCAYYGVLVSVHDQQWLVFHLVQNGLHGSRHLSASLAHQRPWPGILGEYVCATEKIPGAIIGLSVLDAIHQVPLQLFSRPGHDGLPSGEMVAHQAVQLVTSVAKAFQMADQAGCLPRLVHNLETPARPPAWPAL